MARINYTAEFDPEISAKAMGSELHISTKKSSELCRAVRGMHIEKAERYLEDVISLKQAVPFKRYNDSLGHKKGPMAAGRYPVKSAFEMLKLIKNAKNNAEYKGLDTEQMLIAHATANRGRVIHGMRPRARGRASPENTETVNIEIIIKEVQ